MRRTVLLLALVAVLVGACSDDDDDDDDVEVSEPVAPAVSSGDALEAAQALADELGYLAPVEATVASIEAEFGITSRAELVPATYVEVWSDPDLAAIAVADGDGDLAVACGAIVVSSLDANAAVMAEVTAVLEDVLGPC